MCKSHQIQALQPGPASGAVGSDAEHVSACWCWSCGKPRTIFFLNRKQQNVFYLCNCHINTHREERFSIQLPTAIWFYEWRQTVTTQKPELLPPSVESTCHDLHMKRLLSWHLHITATCRRMEAWWQKASMTIIAEGCPPVFWQGLICIHPVWAAYGAISHSLCGQQLAFMPMNQLNIIGTTS